MGHAALRWMHRGEGFAVGDRVRKLDSREPLAYSIEAEMDGAPWVPALDSTFEGAYLASPLARPGALDWVAGTFDTTIIGTVQALVLAGPGTSADLGLGTWWEWTRLTDPGTGVQVVKQPGTVTVQ